MKGIAGQTPFRRGGNGDGENPFKGTPFEGMVPQMPGFGGGDGEGFQSPQRDGIGSGVIIDAKGVALEKVVPGRPGYRKASKSVILRQRDAIELYQKLKAAGDGFVGSYSFQFLDTAKTFAMLRLRSMEHEIQDNLDHVQAFE